MIANKLDSLGAKTRATELRSEYRLCQASENEFVAAAEKLINLVKGPPRQPNVPKWSEALAKVFEIRRERKIQADISAFWIDYAARKTVKNSLPPRLNRIPFKPNMAPLSYFLAEYIKVNQLPAIEGFMTRLRLKLLGNEEQQRELVRLLSNQKLYETNYRKLEPVGTYYNAALQLDTRDTFWLNLKETQRFKFPFQPRITRHSYITLPMSTFGSTEVDALIEWLGRSNVLADLENFDPIYQADGKVLQASAWGIALSTLCIHSYSHED